MGLQQIGPCPALGPGIDMKQVQSLVNEMGTSLSPGAQNLMDMVQFQQQVRVVFMVVFHNVLIIRFQCVIGGSIWFLFISAYNEKRL